MTPEHAELWQRLEAFELDEAGARQPFSVRLARENGWSLRLAQRAIEEYKRFVFLSQTAGIVVCPSEEVDAVWHLHLCYTKSYWNDLCRDLLGRPLHHDPTRGGGEQMEYHQDLYEQTLAAYRVNFGSEPPQDLWPPTAERFATGGRERHVNTAEYWLVRKPGLRAALAGVRRRMSPWMAGAVLLLPAFGAVPNPLDMRGPEFLTFYFWFALVGMVGAIGLRMLLREKDQGEALPVLDEYEAAVLAKGESHAINLAVTDLALSEAIKLSGTGPIMVSREAGSPSSHPLAQRIYETVSPEAEPTLAEVHDLVRPEASKIGAKLESEKLLETSSSFAASRWLSLLVMGCVLGLGALKIAVGISRDKPVAILVMMCVVLVVITFLIAKCPHRTKKGERQFAELKKQYKDRTWQLADPDEDPLDSYRLLGASLFGLATIAAAGGAGADIYNHLKTTLSSSGTSSSGCGTGCGGGGCGGGGCGGGGCGGCGGD